MLSEKCFVYAAFIDVENFLNLGKKRTNVAQYNTRTKVHISPKFKENSENKASMRRNVGKYLSVTQITQT
jgi:hypothetical protein